MSPKVKVLLSLCLNVGLGLGYYFTTRTEVTADSQPVATKALKVSVPKKERPGTVTVTNVIQTEFKWSHLETTDYKEYIKRLRQVGCPEPTIRDIILADLDNVYEPKLNKLRGINPVATVGSYWRVYRKDMSTPKPGPEAEKEIKALQEERAGLLLELLGVTEKSIRSGLDWYDEAAESRFSFLNAEQREKLISWEREMEEKRKTASEMKLSGAVATMQKDSLREYADKKLAEFLSPEEIMEYRLRTSEEARVLRMITQFSEVNESEFRELFKVADKEMKAERDVPVVERNTPENRKKREAQEKETQEAAAAILGAQRFEELKQYHDYGMRQMLIAAPYQGFDKASVLQVNNMKGDALKAVKAINSSETLSAEAKAQALREIRQATEKAISGTIGEKGLRYFRGHGGEWLNTISSSPDAATR